MSNTNLTAESNDLLTRLRGAAESTYIENGETWGTVYLDNVRLQGQTAHQFAGYLSALEAAGVYRKVDGYFGGVRMSH